MNYKHSSFIHQISSFWNSFPLAAIDSAETLASAPDSLLFVPEVQLSLLEHFSGLLVMIKAVSFSSKQPPSSLTT